MPTPWSNDITRSPPMPRPGVPGFAPRPALPLQGVTVLAVEDSRYACEALRLMCQRAGARLRRAETLALARSHLRVYRPDVVIIDLGLPDGRGESLIAELVRTAQRPTAILGTSGDVLGCARAMDAGADGFLEKPYATAASFYAALLAHLPDAAATSYPLGETAISPDPLALHDDLVLAARRLAGDLDATQRGYLAGFLSGIADHSNDGALAQAAALARAPATGDADRGFRQLRDIVRDRLAGQTNVMARPV